MERKTKQGLLILLALILVATLFSINFLNFTGNVVEEQETIKIGFVLPLTGDLSLIGEEGVNGAQIALEEINRQNNQQLELIFEDSQMNPKEGVSTVNKLINIDEVNYIHVFGTPVITAVQPITEEKEVVLTGISIAPKILENASYTLRIFYNLEQAVEKFAGFIEENNYSDIAILYQSGEAWERQVITLEGRGFSFVEKQKFDMGERDFRTTLLKIKESKPKLIILLGYGSHFPSLFQQINELGMQDILILGGLDFVEVPPESVSLYENAVFAVLSFNANPSESAIEFIEKYEEKYGKAPNHQAAYAYDIVNLLYKGITNTDASSEQVVDYIKNLSNYEGAVGNIEILSNGNTRSDLVFATYKNGEIILLE